MIQSKNEQEREISLSCFPCFYNSIFGDTNDDVFEKNAAACKRELQQVRGQNAKEDEGNDGEEMELEGTIDLQQQQIEKQKREFLKAKLENILNPNDNEGSLKMGTRLNEKRKNPYDLSSIEGGGYDECFPKASLSMQDMKNMREREKNFSVADNTAKNDKKKKDMFGRQVAAIGRVRKRSWFASKYV